MGFSSKTDDFGFLVFRIWDTYIGLLGISMWINLWGGSDGVCSDVFVQMGRSDDIVIGGEFEELGWQVGLLELVGISC